MHRIIAVPIIVTLGALLAACNDFTPITDVPTPDAAKIVTSGDGAADAGADGSSSSSGPACYGCLESGACVEPLEKCRSTLNCTAMFDCGLELGCFQPGANLVDCLTICGQRLGLTSSSDPVIGPFLGLYQCATKSCSDACGG